MSSSRRKELRQACWTTGWGGRLPGGGSISFLVRIRGRDNVCPSSVTQPSSLSGVGAGRSRPVRHPYHVFHVVDRKRLEVDGDQHVAAAAAAKGPTVLIQPPNFKRTILFPKRCDPCDHVMKLSTPLIFFSKNLEWRDDGTNSFQGAQKQKRQSPPRNSNPPGEPPRLGFRWSGWGAEVKAANGSCTCP